MDRIFFHLRTLLIIHRYARSTSVRYLLLYENAPLISLILTVLRYHMGCPCELKLCIPIKARFLHSNDILFLVQTSGPPGIGIRPPNSPNTISGVGSYDQLIQQYQQHQNQSQFRFQQMSAANQSFRDQSMKSMQTVQSSPDPFGLLGLLSVIRMSDPDLTSLALGVDLTTLGLNLNSSENLHKTFASPWSDEPAKSDPEFTVLQCYNAKQPPALHVSCSL